MAYLKNLAMSGAFTEFFRRGWLFGCEEISNSSAFTLHLIEGVWRLDEIRNNWAILRSAVQFELRASVRKTIIN